MYATRYIVQLVFVEGFFFFGCTAKDHQEKNTSNNLNQVNQTGERIGPWEIYSDSVLISRGTYVNGKKVGFWTSWYTQGIKNGMWVEWYQEGEIMWKGEWEYGIRHIQGRGARVDIIFVGQIHLPDLQFRDFRNLVSEKEFTLK